MSEGQLWLDPALATDGARNLAAAGQHLAAQRHGAGEEIARATHGRPWGKDDIGQAFERNYRPIEQQVLQAWEQLAAYLEGLGDAAATTVRDNTAADARAGVEVHRSYGPRS